MKTTLLLLTLFLLACRHSKQDAWPGIYNVSTQREEIGSGIVKQSFYRSDVHHDSGPFAVTYLKNNRYYDPFSGVGIRSSYAALLKVTGDPFLESPGGSNEIGFKRGYGLVILEVEGDEIVSITIHD